MKLGKPGRVLVLAAFAMVASVTGATAETKFVLPDTSQWGAPELEILHLEQGRSAAIARHDTLALRRIYAAEFRGVTATGYVVDRETLLDVFKRDDPTSAFTIDELSVHVLGKNRDIAVLTGRLTTTRTTGLVGQSRFLHAYTKRDGRWQILFGQGTPVHRSSSRTRDVPPPPPDSTSAPPPGRSP